MSRDIITDVLTYRLLQFDIDQIIYVQ